MAVRVRRDRAFQESYAQLTFARVPGLSDSLAAPMGGFMENDQARHVVAGSLARTTAQCAIHPIDTVKTRLQVSKPGVPQLVEWKKLASKGRVWLALPGRVALKTRNYLPFGVMDVFRGFPGAFLGTIPVATLYFVAYEGVKLWANETCGTADRLGHLAASAAGALASSLLKVPTDTIRHRTQAYLHPNVFKAMPQILDKKGVHGFFAGFGPTILRDVPEIAIQFTLYEVLRAEVSKRIGGKPTTWQHLCLGGVTGGVAALATMPIDVLKTQMQCGGAEMRRMGLVRVVEQMVRAQGVAALFAGMGPRVMQTAVMSSLFFTFFEFWKAQLKPDSLRHDADKELSRKLYDKPREHIWKRQFSYR